MKNLVENISVQKEFIQRLSYNLRNFKWKQNGANFSCPICGDSKKNPTKARGYLFEKKNLFQFFCHNCSFSSNFSFFLKNVNPALHSEYVKELFVEKKKEGNFRRREKPLIAEVKKELANSAIPAPTIESLPDNHITKCYVKRRKLPQRYFEKLHYVSKFGDWIRKHYNPDYRGENDERIIIPFYNGQKELVAFQGRSICGNTKLRYVTFKVQENAPKIFNFDEVQVNKKIYLVEGPFDSMFLPNSMAAAGSDVTKLLDRLDYDIVFVPDREPRNYEIVKKVANMIDRKYKVALLPDSMPGKDINEYILNGFSIQQVTSMIDRFTFEGLQASFQLKMWKCI